MHIVITIEFSSEDLMIFARVVRVKWRVDHCEYNVVLRLPHPSSIVIRSGARDFAAA